MTQNPGPVLRELDLEDGEASVAEILSPARYETYRSQIPSARNPRYDKLTTDQVVSIFAYTLEQEFYSYRELNSGLRQLKMSERCFSLVQVINGAIKLIGRDRQAGVYFRYTLLSPSQLRKHYEAGKTSAHPFFTSASENNRNHVSASCNVLIRIMGRKDRLPPAYIAELSRYPAEGEYLFEPNSYFKVLMVTEIKPEQFDVLLLERSI